MSDLISNIIKDYEDGTINVYQLLEKIKGLSTAKEETGDLISRKAFKQQVSVMAIKENLDIEKIGAMLKLIDAQPTAYDVDKVVEQVEDIMNDERVRFVDQAVNRTIRIVKGGGVDETNTI